MCHDEFNFVWLFYLIISLLLFFLLLFILEVLLFQP